MAGDQSQSALNALPDWFTIAECEPEKKGTWDLPGSVYMLSMCLLTAFTPISNFTYHLYSYFQRSLFHFPFWIFSHWNRCLLEMQISQKPSERLPIPRSKLVFVCPNCCIFSSRQRWKSKWNGILKNWMPGLEYRMLVFQRVGKLSSMSNIEGCI